MSNRRPWWRADIGYCPRLLVPSATRRAAPIGGNDRFCRIARRAVEWGRTGSRRYQKVVQGYYKKLFDEVVGPRYRNSAPPPGSDQPKQLRQMAANQYLTDHYHEAPVWIVACLEGDNPGYSSGASIYPAVENMLLAARALGLGSTLTTRHIGYAKECDEAMGIPPNYHSYAILPIGYPMGRFGPVGRGPLSEVVYLDGWGKSYPGI